MSETAPSGNPPEKGSRWRPPANARNVEGGDSRSEVRHALVLDARSRSASRSRGSLAARLLGRGLDPRMTLGNGATGVDSDA